MRTAVAAQAGLPDAIDAVADGFSHAARVGRRA